MTEMQYKRDNKSDAGLGGSLRIRTEADLRGYKDGGIRDARVQYQE